MVIGLNIIKVGRRGLASPAPDTGLRRTFAYSRMIICRIYVFDHWRRILGIASLRQATGDLHARKIDLLDWPPEVSAARGSATHYRSSESPSTDQHGQPVVHAGHVMAFCSSIPKS